MHPLKTLALAAGLLASAAKGLAQEAPRELILDEFNDPGSWSCAIAPDEGVAVGRAVPRPIGLPLRSASGPEAPPLLYRVRADFFARGTHRLAIVPRLPILVADRCLAISVLVHARRGGERVELIIEDFLGLRHALFMGSLGASSWTRLTAVLPPPGPDDLSGIVQYNAHFDRSRGISILGLSVESAIEEPARGELLSFAELSASVAPGPEEPGIGKPEAGASAPSPIRTRAAEAGTGGPSTAGVVALIERRMAERKTYPRLARERGIEGTVVLAARVDADGGLADARIAESSGSALLDRAAIGLLRSVFPVPNDSRAAFAFEERVVYRLAAP